jgi:hypothetical protein
MTAPYCPDLRRSIDEHRGRPGRPTGGSARVLARAVSYTSRCSPRRRAVQGCAEVDGTSPAPANSGAWRSSSARWVVVPAAP